MRLWHAALDLLYPPRCCACEGATDRPAFCIRCRSAIRVLDGAECETCGIPFQTTGGSNHLCGRCLARRPRFRRARACATYDAAEESTDPLKAVLHRYKYQREVGLAGPLAELMQQRCPMMLAAYDVIVPVPLHAERLRWRGFNQALLLAQRLGEAAGVRVDPFSLDRIRATRPQVQLDEHERRRNVAGAFQVVRPDTVRQRAVLLVDDVYTTGATVNACSAALLSARATAVDVLVLARAILR